MNFPHDTTYASQQTEVRISYDKQFLYIAAICLDKNPRQVIASSLRRDFDVDANDNISVFIDPFGDGTTGFTFSVTPLGVEREGLISNGAFIAAEWDNKWFSAVKLYDDRWIAEMAIPLKTLRYKQEIPEWRINFARYDVKNNQRSTWVPVPIAYRVSSLAFTGKLRFSEALPTPGANVSVIPYATASTSKNYINDKGTPVKPGFGADAKIAVTPALNLDLTVNPDFSQVEVDAQVTNLDRFEIFFPERRQFFLENSDLFGGFGFRRIRPFFSRRIGIGRDTLTGQIVQNTILYGARLSGKLNKDLRVGLLNMQTASDDAAGIAGQNFTVATAQYKVFSRSNVSAILVNRQNFGSMDNDRYTRLAGIDYNLQSADNRWSGKFFFHKAFRPEQKPDSYAHASYLEYRTRKLRVEWNHEYVGENYQINDIGFVTRRGIWRLEPKANLFFYPSKGNIVQHGPGISLDYYSDLDFVTADRNIDIFYDFTFANTSNAYIGVYQYFTRMVFGFDPTNSGGVPLPEGSTYNYSGVFWGYSTDSRKLLNVGVDGFAGAYFNGRIFNLVPSVNYRLQPYGAIGIRAEYNNISLPEPYSSAAYLLIGPRIDVSLTRNFFITTFLQYNEQADNVNINTRIQWRFKPVSDLFVVYSDNYFPGDFKVKSRALVVKLSYWLNV
jgi:hypothetical protein